MDLTSFALIVAGFLAFAVISGRLEGTIITAPLVFVLFGFAVSEAGLDLVRLDVDNSAIHLVAECTLILVLFADAARINLNRVRKDHDLPVRMLVIGLPLAMLGGTVIASQLFPAFGFWEAALLAALLAPTDAALSQAVVAAKVIPIRIRQAINVETGLNDGIALPAVLLLAALAAAHEDAGEAGSWVRFAALQLTLGPLTGVILGYAGGRLLDVAAERGWATQSFQGIGILALAALTYIAAEMAGGNGFIAVFVGGMVFGNAIRHPCSFLFEFMETEGQLLMLITFFIFGAILLPAGMAHAQPIYFVYAVLSLTVIRMIPIAVSLIGTRVSWPTQLFLGWFGPRGLASILFVLLIVEEAALPHGNELLSVTVITVALSTLLHGVSAAPFARLYGNLVSRMGECKETKEVMALPLRHGHV
jgi:NhaP-type Na+/H+ or K+/H+ antiporter